MSMMEKLFVEIFERKKRIIDQVKQQTIFFDQYMSSKCLLEGIEPPPWLLSHEVHPSNKVFEATQDRLSVSPQFPVNDARGSSRCAQKPDSGAAASPLDQRDGMVLDVSPMPAQSLARIQRSKSRQRALELRNSAKTVKSHLSDQKNNGAFASAITGSEILPLHHDQVHELELVELIGINNERREVDVEAAKLGDFHRKEKELNEKKLISGLLLPGVQPENCYSSGDHVCNYKETILSENEELPDGLFTEVHALCKGPVAADGKSDFHQYLVSDAGCASNGVLELDTSATSPPYQIQMRKSDIDKGPLQSLARVTRSKSQRGALEICDSSKGAENFCAENNICVHSTVVAGSGITSVLSDNVHESEIVKTDNFDNEICVMEKRVSCSQSKEMGSKICLGRITRSQSHAQQTSSTKKLSNVDEPTYIGRSSRDKNYVACAKSSEQQTEENLTLSREVGGQLADTVSASSSLMEDETAKSNVNQSPVDEMDHMENHKTAGFISSLVGNSSLQLEHVNELELVKPAEINYERSAVEEQKVGDFQDKQKSSPICSGRIRRSQGSSQQANFTQDSLNVGNSFCDPKIGDFLDKQNDSNIYSGRITRSRSSSQQASSTRDLLNASNSFSTGRSSCDDQNAGSSKSRQQSRKKSVLLAGGSSSENKGSWPLSKQKNVGGQLNDSLSASPSLREGDAKSNVSKSGGEEMAQSGGCHVRGRSQSSPRLQVEEGELCFEEKNSSANTLFAFVQEDSEVPCISSLANRAIKDSKASSDVEAVVADSSSDFPDSSKQCIVGENEGCCLAGSPHRQSMELIGAEIAMPEFEGFIMQRDNGPPCIGENIDFDKLNLRKSTIERASIIEQLCKSASMHTPLSHFSTTYKLHRAPSLYQSVPNGLLECMDLRSNLPMNDDADNQIKVSGFNEEVALALEGKSYSDCLPSSTSQFSWDIRKPFTSPVGRLRDIITLNSGSSEKRGSLIPELPCIKEENENTQEVADVFDEGICSEVMPFSAKREALADITEDPNLPASVSKAEIFAARNSVESVKTDYSFTGTCNRVEPKFGRYNSSKKQHIDKLKVSNSISLGESGINRLRESVRSKFSKPKLSRRPSLRKGGLSLAEKERKGNNIVSNITSFIPLVQQKQPAAIITGKRDVKVKALEAAEAAKRLAQDKENERKMKKEALKLERARLEQENLKQLELQKKKKEEERKKKDAEIAARKRQREEDERKEKERKRKRVFEIRKQQRENDEKLHGKKENIVKEQSMEERGNKLKVSRDETDKDNRKGKEMTDGNLAKMLKTEPKGIMALASDAGKSSTVLEVSETLAGCGGNTKFVSNLDKATENDNLGTNEDQEESYVISPYKSSDDEDDEEDDIRNSKFIPSWASKNKLAAVIASQQRVSPESIFPPRSFCSIAQVLWRHKNKKPQRK